jgi:hypothetical protein
MIDWDNLKKGVCRFNSISSEVAADTALHEVLGRGLTIENIAPIVLSVNYFWRANVETTSGRLGQYCELFNEDFENILTQITFLRDYSLPVYHEEMLYRRIITPAQKFLWSFVGTFPRRRNYSFVTKLMFWLVNLPPSDKNAQNTIRRVSGWNLSPPDNATADQYRACYAMLIRFYNECLKDLEQYRRTRDLVEIDFQSQPSFLRRRNTPVRILDKYLWIEGRGL